MLNYLQVKATFLLLRLGILTQSHIVDENVLEKAVTLSAQINMK